MNQKGSWPLYIVGLSCAIFTYWVLYVLVALQEGIDAFIYFFQSVEIGGVHIPPIGWLLWHIIAILWGGMYFETRYKPWKQYLPLCGVARRFCRHITQGVLGASCILFVWSAGLYLFCTALNHRVDMAMLWAFVVLAGEFMTLAFLTLGLCLCVEERIGVLLALILFLISAFGMPQHGIATSSLWFEPNTPLWLHQRHWQVAWLQAIIAYGVFLFSLKKQVYDEKHIMRESVCFRK